MSKPNTPSGFWILLGSDGGRSKTSCSCQQVSPPSHLRICRAPAEHVRNVTIFSGNLLPLSICSLFDHEHSAIKGRSLFATPHPTNKPNLLNQTVPVVPFHPPDRHLDHLAIGRPPSTTGCPVRSAPAHAVHDTDACGTKTP